MNLSKPLSSLMPTLEAEVLTVLAGANASFTGRQVHALVGASSESGIRRALQRLSIQGIVTCKRAGASDLYELNPDHLMARYIKSIVNLRSELFETIADAISKWAVAPICGAIFGSAVRSDMQPESDIDIFIVRPDLVKPGMDSWEEQGAALTKKVSQWTGNDVQIFELSESEVEVGVEKKDEVLLEIINEAIIFFGPDEYLRTLRFKNGDRTHG